MATTSWQKANRTLLRALDAIDAADDPVDAVRAAAEAVTDLDHAARRAHTIRETHLARGADRHSVRAIAEAARLSEGRVRQIIADAGAGRSGAYRKPVPTPTEINGWVQRYTGGETVSAIAADAGRPREVVRRRIEAAGIDVWCPEGRGDVNNPEWLQQAYDAGLTLRQIADACGSSAPTVRRRLIQAGITGDDQ